MPENLRPPKGPASLSSSGAFTHTMPTTSSLTARTLSLRSLVNTVAPSPNRESLARSIASSKLATRQIGATGPKLSAFRMSISGVASVSTVGSTNQPLLKPAGRPPPQASLAPCSTARATTAS